MNHLHYWRYRCAVCRLFELAHYVVFHIEKLYTSRLFALCFQVVYLCVTHNNLYFNKLATYNIAGTRMYILQYALAFL